MGDVICTALFPSLKKLVIALYAHFILENP